MKQITKEYLELIQKLVNAHLTKDEAKECTNKVKDIINRRKQNCKSL